jgi:hypothetical protein
VPVADFCTWVSNTQRKLEATGARLVRVVMPDTMEGAIINEISGKANVVTKVRRKRGKMSGGLQLTVNGVHIVFDHRVHPTNGQSCLLLVERTR